MNKFHFSTIPQGFHGRNPKYKGDNVKGIGRLHNFWDYETL